MMQDTIKSKRGGYTVRRTKNIETDELRCAVYDGDHLLFLGIKMPMEFFREEQIDNECFNICEIFTTRVGRRWIYWRDEEADVDYLTIIPDGNKMRGRRSA